jgi:hypothetical protein
MALTSVKLLSRWTLVERWRELFLLHTHTHTHTEREREREREKERERENDHAAGISCKGDIIIKT